MLYFLNYIIIIEISIFICEIFIFKDNILIMKANILIQNYNIIIINDDIFVLLYNIIRNINVLFIMNKKYIEKFIKLG